jgi:hypothetical protein
VIVCVCVYLCDCVCVCVCSYPWYGESAKGPICGGSETVLESNGHGVRE